MNEKRQTIHMIGICHHTMCNRTFNVFRPNEDRLTFALVSSAGLTTQWWSCWGNTSTGFTTGSTPSSVKASPRVLPCRWGLLAALTTCFIQVGPEPGVCVVGSHILFIFSASVCFCFVAASLVTKFFFETLQKYCIMQVGWIKGIRIYTAHHLL